MADRILLRRDTFTNWSVVNPVLGSGEWAFVLDNGTYRVGDGVTPFNSLTVYHATGEVRTINSTSPTNGDVALNQDNIPDGTTYVRVSSAEKSSYDAKLDDAPIDGNQYARQDGAWVEVTASGGGAVDSVNGYTGAVVLSQDDVAEGATYQRVTSAEKATYENKLNDITGTGEGVVYGRAVIDGNNVWTQTLTGLAVQPDTITKNASTPWSDILTSINNLTSKNWNGYEVQILLESEADHPLGSTIFELQGIFNGRLRIVGGTNSTITLDNTGYFKFLNCQLNIDISDVGFVLTSSGHTVPFNVDGNMIISTYNCTWNASTITQDAAMFFLAGCKVASFQDTFTGSISNTTNFVKLNRGADEAQGGEVQIYNSTLAGNPFTNAVSGKGTVASSFVNGVFTNIAVDGAIDVTIGEGGGTIDKATLSAISLSNVTQSSVDVTCTFNRAGNLYWGVYADGSPVPTLADLTGGVGTGLVESGVEPATAGGATTGTPTSLASATAYDVYTVALDTLSNPSEKKLAVFTTTGAGLVAAVLGVPTMGDTTADLTWTDTNTSPNEVGVLVEYKESSSGTWLTATTTAADVTSYQVTSLTAGTSYDFRVTPQGDGGAVLDAPPSNIETASTTGGGGGTWQDTMKASMVALNPHWSAGQVTWAEGIIDTVMANGSYYETTYGAGGTNETDANWFLLFGLNGDTSTASTSKNGDPLRIDANGTVSTDNVCPEVLGVVDGYLIVSTTDDWFQSGLDLQSCSLSRELPEFPVNISYTTRLSGNALTGSLPANFGSNSGSTVQINDCLLTGTIPDSTESKVNMQWHNNGFTAVTNGGLGYYNAWMSTANFSGNALPESEVDGILLAVRDFYTATAPSTNLNLNISGGTNAIPSATGLGYRDEILTIYTNAGRTASITLNE